MSTVLTLVADGKPATASTATHVELRVFDVPYHCFALTELLTDGTAAGVAVPEQPKQLDLFMEN